MANQLHYIDPDIWKACAGGTVKIPTVNSRVYYFPQGHAEQASTRPDFRPFCRKTPVFLCRIISVCFQADQETDEVFARIRLEPISDRSPSPVFANSGEENLGSEPKNVASFAKVLTASDANNGGGFSVPRFCADSIFPPLNYKVEPPVQTISVKDVHGGVWDFRHIFRGTPRRHLLTTGWSKFVTSKRLVAGDSAVFMKNRNGELFVGVRRASRMNMTENSGKLMQPPFLPAGKDSRTEETYCSRNFSRNGGRISAESVVEAVKLAEQDRVFEVVYYPKAGTPEFCVREELVNAAMNVFWSAGTRFKMAMETEDSSRVTWFLGTVSSAVVVDPICWPNSPWRLLQVIWDEPEVLQNVNRVNPWQVEVVPSTQQLQATFPFPKRLRVSQNPDLLGEGDAAMCFPVMGLTNTVMGHLSSSLFSYNSVPAGMQGARHDSIIIPSTPHFSGNRTGCLPYSDSLYCQNFVSKLSPLPTELTIGGTSCSEISSPQSLDHMHSFSTESNQAGTSTEESNQAGTSTSKPRRGAFQLFGKTIHTETPLGIAFDCNGCMENATVVCKAHRGAEGICQPPNQTIAQLDA